MKTNHSTRLVILSSAFLAAALFSGCATGPTVRTDPDTMAPFVSYKSFAMVRTSRLPAAGNPAVTPMLMRQTRVDAEAAFVAKGLARAPESTADLLVLVHGGLEEKIDVTNWGFSYGRFGRGRSYDIDQYQQGTILIDVFDARTKELVWRGSAVGEVGDSPKPDKVKATIDAIVARYPN